MLAIEAEALGSAIIPCRLTQNLLSFNRAFDRVLSAGNYDIVHSHVHDFSGYILWRAARRGVPTRIAHSFTAPPSVRLPVTRRIYQLAMQRMIYRYANLGLGNSTESMQALFGPVWQKDKRWKLLYCGIDLASFEYPGDRSSTRSNLGIPQDALVIGHVGRLSPAKNHRFILQLAQEVTLRRKNVWFLLVGDGPLRQELEDRAKVLGLNRVVFAGAVERVEPFLAAMNLFVFPSLWEGLPQSVIEAQAAGLRCICSTAVTSEVAVVPDAARFVTLEEGATVWANICLASLEQPPLDRHKSLRIVADSPFAIMKSVNNLSDVYTAMLADCTAR